jgi:hypothetical protein
MKFSIDYKERKENRILTYDANEFGFGIEPKVMAIDFGLTLNTLELTVAGDDRKVIEVLGFCGYKEWTISKLITPKYMEGSLRVIDNLESGVGSYRIRKEIFPIFVDVHTGWICFGNPQDKGLGVEFINNCVALISNDNEFLSLWLKPQSLPNL